MVDVEFQGEFSKQKKSTWNSACEGENVEKHVFLPLFELLGPLTRLKVKLSIHQ